MASNPSETSDSATASTRYVSIRSHRQGGLGLVCRANDSQLNREVAVKFIQAKFVDDPVAVKQFEIEAEITGRLEHPGVAPVYTKGTTESGIPFYAMRFVEGRDFNEEIDAFYQRVNSAYDSVEFSRLLQTFISVCKTVAYAHSRGIVHRDLKPQNIRVGRFDETIVLDWGLAASVDRSEVHRMGDESTMILSNNSPTNQSSRSGGTPAYMSPEQLSGLVATPASDIYSLGATLYRLLTGISTTEAVTGANVRESLIEGRVNSPCERQPRLPKQLQAICQKAMAIQPASRYTTAMELASDIEQFLAGSSVSCYTETPYEKCGRWIHHNQIWARHLAFGLVTIAIASIGAAAFTTQLASSRNIQRLEAEDQRNAAALSREEALQAKRKSLALSALLGARSIAAEIELRGAILREEVSSARLRKLVSQLNADPSDDEIRSSLNSWIRDRYLARVTESLPTSSWSLQGIDGTQFARVAPREPESSAQSIGKNFRHRDYFHALGQDLDPASPDAASAKPHRHDVHVSAVFVGSITKRLSVSFSTPIYSEPTERNESDIIGLLSSTVLLDKLDLLPGSILVDIRENTIEGQPIEGLVLRHEEFEHDLALIKSPQQLIPDDRKRLMTWLRTHSPQLSDLKSRSSADLISITDPVTGEKIDMAAASVVFANQPEHNQVGWVILIRETSDGLR